MVKNCNEEQKLINGTTSKASIDRKSLNLEKSQIKQSARITSRQSNIEWFKGNINKEHIHKRILEKSKSNKKADVDPPKQNVIENDNYDDDFDA